MSRQCNFDQYIKLDLNELFLVIVMYLLGCEYALILAFPVKHTRMRAKIACGEGTSREEAKFGARALPIIVITTRIVCSLVCVSTEESRLRRLLQKQSFLTICLAIKVLQVSRTHFRHVTIAMQLVSRQGHVAIAK